MSPQEQALFKALGARIAALRKQQGLTQTQLAEELGIAQQTLAHYEVGRLRMPVSLLPAFAQRFTVGIDELLMGESSRSASGRTKRGPAPRLQRQMERIARLPRMKQQLVIDMLDGLLAQAGR